MQESLTQTGVRLALVVSSPELGDKVRRVVTTVVRKDGWDLLSARTET